MARHLYHDAMITDGETEKARFMVETDILPAETDGFLQKCVAMYRIAQGWHSLLAVHIDDIWPTMGQRQTMLSRMEYENALETIGNMSTEKIMPHLIRVIQTTQWIIEACWTRGQIKIFAEIMHPSDVRSAHLRVQGRDVPDAEEYELPGTSVGRRRGVSYTDTAVIDTDIDMQDPALDDVGWPSNITQSPSITGNGTPQTATNLCRIRLERGNTVTYMCRDGVPNPESWPKTEIRCSARDGTETKVLWVSPETGTQYMSRAVRYGDVVPRGCTGIIDVYETEMCPICCDVLFDTTTTQVDTFYCEEQQSHVAHSKCVAESFRQQAADKGLYMDSDKDVLTLIGPAFKCVLCGKQEVDTRTRRSQERKEPYPELLNVLQHLPTDTPATVALRELWRGAAQIFGEQQTEGSSIFILCVIDMKDKWNVTNAEGPRT